MSKNTGIEVTLESLAELGQVWARQCHHDSPQPLVVHAIMVTDETGATWKRTISTYAGKATERVLIRFTEQPGRLLDDPAREIHAMTRQGYPLVAEHRPTPIPDPEPQTPEPEAPRRRRGRKAAAPR